MKQRDETIVGTADPENLLDSLIQRLNLKNDAALCRALEVAPPVISKIRNRRLPVGASILIRMHEVSNLSIRELKGLLHPNARNEQPSSPSKT
jgi:hypothetical protein